MTGHPLIGRVLERIADGTSLGRAAYAYTDRDSGEPWVVLVHDDGTFGRACLSENSTTRVRVEPPLAYPVQDRGDCVAQLQASTAGMRTAPRSVAGDCVTGDGTMYELRRAGDSTVEIRINGPLGEACAYARRADLLAVLGFRADP